MSNKVYSERSRRRHIRSRVDEHFRIAAEKSLNVALAEEDLTLEIKAVDGLEYQNGTDYEGNVADEDYLVGSLMEVEDIDLCVEHYNVYFDDNDLSDEFEEHEEVEQEPDCNVRERLAEWATHYNISHAATNALLVILKPLLLDIPFDARSLLSTPKVTDIKSVGGGQYYHFGISHSLSSVLNASKISLNDIPGILTLHINIDGVPLSRSSNLCLWPILGMLKEIPRLGAFTLGIYSGKSKPNSVDDYLRAFVDDMLTVVKTGIHFQGKYINIALPDAFICDAPARAFLKCTKGHTGYYGCERCSQKGVYHNIRVIYPKFDSLFKN
ncbi:uncharacterized protein LOC136092161 [Hydra vulgaris]|uniref:Uncharacterized protein LOC136092161 n=1 Tax=Hydra vulgaris TaxID=6087 RepID=A0ABM4DN28_HYDVU